MYKSILILLFVLMFSGCHIETGNGFDNNINKNIEKISFIDSIYNAKCNNYRKKVLIDSKKNIFLFFNKYLYLKNFKKNNIYKYHINNNSTFNLKDSIDTFDNKYIYSNMTEFYLFDDHLMLIYSSKNFLTKLSDSNRLGLSGFQIQYKKLKNKIVLSYKLFSDVEPIIKNTLLDTIFTSPRYRPNISRSNSKQERKTTKIKSY